ncbi:unnamed protein product [Prunus armeniaca]|uniref:Uncharacterized protein n=1 Tax=Prunus armeniaca TaxID=36596 RepID=A0A6J5X6V9_PRUAR|nr:unnamed protein product [Prunus armeniaca]
MVPTYSDLNSMMGTLQWKASIHLCTYQRTGSASQYTIFLPIHEVLHKVHQLLKVVETPLFLFIAQGMRIGMWLLQTLPLTLSS